MKRVLYIVLIVFAALPVMAAEPIDTIRLATMMENEQYEDIVRLTTRELKHFPKSGSMYYYRSQAYNHLDQLPEAISDLSHAIRYPKEINLPLSDLYTLRAGMYLQMQDTASAFADYAQAIRRAGKHPRNARYYTARAAAYAYYGCYRQAADDYEQAISFEPENAAFQLEWARYLVLSGRIAPAKQLLEDLSALHPEQIEAPYLLAVLLCYQEEEYHQSVEWLVTYLTRYYLVHRIIGDTDILDLVAAIDYPYVYALLSQEIQRYDKAEQYELCDLFYLLRARLLNQRGYADDALADIDSVSIFSFPREYERSIAVERFNSLIKLRRWQEVIDRSSTFIEQDPESSPFYGVRATGYYYTDRLDAAESDLLRAYRLDSSARTMTLLAMLYTRTGKHAEAARYYTLLLNRGNLQNEEFAAIYLLRGQSYLAMHDTLAANDDFYRVLMLDNTYRNSVRHYALYRLGRTEEAVAWVDKLLSEYPDADNFYHAACIYALEQQTDKALQYLETALRWGYSDPHQITYDTDLDGLRSNPDFQLLVQRYVAPKTKTEKKK